MSEARCFSEIDVIPGKLVVRIFEHSIDLGSSQIRCWSYVTDGLVGQQQKEMVLTLQRWPELQTPPRDPLAFFNAVYLQALLGNLVDAGDTTELAGDDLLLGRPAVLYLPAQRLAGIKLPEPALAGILLPTAELEAARRFGPMRVVNRLAQAHGFYPYPPWSDIHRRAMCFDTTRETSGLSMVELRGHARARIVRSADELILRVDPRATIELRDRIRPLPENQALALWTGPNSEANASMAWNPELSEAGTGTVLLPSKAAAAASFAGSFLAIAPGQEQNSWRAVEDGFELRLTQEAWDRLRPALMSGRPSEIPLVDGIRFRLDWCRENHARLLVGAPFESESRIDLSRDVDGEPLGDTYLSPHDGAQYHASEGWRRYSPDPNTEVDLAEGPAILREIVLLTPEDELEQRLAIADLSDFTKLSLQVVQDYLATLPEDDVQELCVEFRIQPGGTLGVKLSAQPGLPDTTLRPLRVELMNLMGPAVRGGSVGFQMFLILWGKAPEEA